MSIPDHKEIYLIDSGDGVVWCDDPAPGNDMDESDAVKYVRADTIGWQPIETAPKDAVVDLYSQTYGRVTSYWDDKGSTWVPLGLTADATHWIPRPKPPGAEDSK